MSNNIEEFVERYDKINKDDDNNGNPDKKSKSSETDKAVVAKKKKKNKKKKEGEAIKNEGIEEIKLVKVGKCIETSLDPNFLLLSYLLKR